MESGAQGAEGWVGLPAPLALKVQPGSVDSVSPSSALRRIAALTTTFLPLGPGTSVTSRVKAWPFAAPDQWVFGFLPAPGAAYGAAASWGCVSMGPTSDGPCGKVAAPRGCVQAQARATSHSGPSPATWAPLPGSPSLPCSHFCEPASCRVHGRRLLRAGGCLGGLAHPAVERRGGA